MDPKGPGGCLHGAGQWCIRHPVGAHIVRPRERKPPSLKIGLSFLHKSVYNKMDIGYTGREGQSARTGGKL